MEDLKDTEMVVFGDTQNSIITGAKLMLITMVVLALQDLNLEKNFKGLKRYFVVSKKEKRDVENMVSAFEYLFGDDGDYPLSFENFCFVFKLEPSLFRRLIRQAIKTNGGIANTEFVIWENRNAV